MVLTGPQDPAAHAELVRLTGLPLDRFEELYWADRHAYDEGKLTGIEFWQKIIRDGDIHISEADTHRLNLLDGRMWSTVNDRMVAWQAQLKQSGLLTGILLEILREGFGSYVEVFRNVSIVYGSYAFALLFMKLNI